MLKIFDKFYFLSLKGSVTYVLSETLDCSFRGENKIWSFKGLHHSQINNYVIITSEDWCVSKKGLKDLIRWIITIWLPLTAGIIYFLNRKKTRWLIKFIFNCDHTSIQISYFYGNTFNLPYGKVISGFHTIKTDRAGEKVKSVTYLLHKNNKLSSGCQHTYKNLTCQ